MAPLESELDKYFATNRILMQAVVHARVPNTESLISSLERCWNWGPTRARSKHVDRLFRTAFWYDMSASDQKTFREWESRA